MCELHWTPVYSIIGLDRCFCNYKIYSYLTCIVIYVSIRLRIYLFHGNTNKLSNLHFAIVINIYHLFTYTDFLKYANGKFPTVILFYPFQLSRYIPYSLGYILNNKEERQTFGDHVDRHSPYYADVAFVVVKSHHFLVHGLSPDL